MRELGRRPAFRFRNAGLFLPSEGVHSGRQRRTFALGSGPFRALEVFSGVPDGFGSQLRAVNASECSANRSASAVGTARGWSHRNDVDSPGCKAPKHEPGSRVEIVLKAARTRREHGVRARSRSESEPPGWESLMGCRGTRGTTGGQCLRFALRRAVEATTYSWIGRNVDIRRSQVKILRVQVW